MSGRVTGPMQVKIDRLEAENEQLRLAVRQLTLDSRVCEPCSKLVEEWTEGLREV
jgi:hypothetical protein